MATCETVKPNGIDWNGDAGRAWVDCRELLDNLFRPIELDIIAHVAALSPKSVLDVGCGTGATTLALARALGPATHCVGIDVSSPMIAVAEERAEVSSIDARFIAADAANYAFTPGAFDVLVSRFGVMFFDEPVRAFKNLRSASERGAVLSFYAWRSPAENPFMTVAERAAGPLLPKLEPKSADAPGQFGFADRNRVRRILDESQWTKVEIQPVNYNLTLPVADLEPYYVKMGSVGRLLEMLEDGPRARIIDAMRPGFEEYVIGNAAEFEAACWHISAVAD
jgi:SAM-dependent methyltransferase